jgi:large subunit ribosomal protein L7A
MLEELKSSKKAVGLKQSIKAIENGTAKKLYIARDAEERVIRNIIKISNEKKILIVYIDSMKALGKACGINVGAAVACLI